jgi:hypothetical protein
MSRLARCLLTCALLVVVPPPAGAVGPATMPAAVDGAGIVVELDQSELDAGPGEKLSFESTIRNTGDAPLEGYVAHLNILTTDESVYVDPEDWSPRRTQYLDDLAAGDSATLTWTVQAVTSGPLILFVSVTSPTTDAVTSSGPLQLTVGGQRVVNAGRVLPVVLWTPGAVLLLLGGTFLRRRRHR